MLCYFYIIYFSCLSLINVLPTASTFFMSMAVKIPPSSFSPRRKFRPYQDNLHHVYKMASEEVEFTDTINGRSK